MASVRWGGLRLEPYNPDAVDADNDGIVQEGTAWERPAGTRLLDELGNEVERGLQSMQRPTLRVVDRDGNTIDYKPTYQRGTPGGGLRKQQKLSTLGELGYPSLKEMGVRSIGDMVPTIGDIVRPKQKVVDVEGSVFNMKRKITPDRIIPKRGNRQRAFNRADEKAKELAFMQGDHYLVETDSEFLILSPNEFDNFFDEVNGPDGMPSGLAISKYEKPRPKQADDAAIRADLLGPREMEIDDAAYRDALFDIHYNYGNPAFLDDDLFIPVVFDENLEMGGSELLNPDGSQTTFEDIMTGVRKLEYGEEFENRRFKFRQLKSEFLQSDSHGGLWSVFQVTDKETGEVWYVKGSTYPANDAVMELLGMRAGSLLDLAARPDGRNIRISPQATVRIVGDRSVRWTAMRNVGEWNHPDGEILAWVDGHEGGGLDPDKVDVGDMAQILAMDFIFGNTDRHTGNLMIATDANGRQRLAIIDNGILAGGRLHSEKDQFGFDLSVKDITDRLEAEASKQPDEIFNDPSGNYLVHDPAFKTMNARLGDIDGDGGEFIDATQRTVQAIKENLDALFDLREYSRRGVPLTPAERAHLEGVKKVALARIEMLEKDPDLIWYQAWSPIPGQIQAPQGNLPGNAPNANSADGESVPSIQTQFASVPKLIEATRADDSLATPTPVDDEDFGFKVYLESKVDEDNPDIPEEGSPEWYDELDEWIGETTAVDGYWSDGVRGALDNYLGQYYDSINGALRSGDETPSQDYPELQKYLMSRKLPEGLVIHRGISHWYDEDGEPSWYLEEGDIVVDKAFQSFSSRPRSMAGERGNKGADGEIQIIATVGANVRGQSVSWNGENEVLLPAGVKYRIDEISEDEETGKTIWRVTILQQGEGIDVQRATSTVTTAPGVDSSGTKPRAAAGLPEVDFDEPIELAELRGQIDSIDKDLLTGIQEALGTDSEELVQTLIPPRTDSDAILSRSFSDGWYEAAEEKIRDSDIADSEKEKLLTLLDDARVSDELKDISPYLTELIPFADPLGGDFVFQPAAAPYDTEEARRKYQEAFSRLSPERRDLISTRIDEIKKERKRQDRIEERERFRQQARAKAEAAVQDEINKAKQKFIQKPVETRKYDAPVGEALTGVRERNGSDIEYDPDSVRPVKQIQTDADSVLVKAADLSLPEHEEELVDFLISDELSDITDELEAPYDPLINVAKRGEKPHDILARLLIERRGFDGDAMKVTSSELDQLIGEGYREMTRGGSRRPQDEFISGEMLIGTGVDGAGLYFATETFDPTAVPPGWGHFDASTYARDASDGAVIRGVMNPSAQYLDIEDVRQELDQYGRAMAGQFPTPKNSRLADLRRRLEARAERDDKAAKALRTLDAILTARDGENNPAVTTAALLLGADAVQDLGLNNRSIVYNRSAVITGDALLTPDENDALKGFEQFKARHNQKLIADGRLPLDPTPEQVKQWRDAEVERMLEEFDRLAADSV